MHLNIHLSAMLTKRLWKMIRNEKVAGVKWWIIWAIDRQHKINRCQEVINGNSC